MPFKKEMIILSKRDETYWYPAEMVESLPYKQYRVSFLATQFGYFREAR